MRRRPRLERPRSSSGSGFRSGIAPEKPGHPGGSTNVRLAIETSTSSNRLDRLADHGHDLSWKDIESVNLRRVAPRAEGQTNLNGAEETDSEAATRRDPSETRLADPPN
jgi:hypothetical protein